MKTFRYDIIGSALDINCESEDMISQFTSLIGEWEIPATKSHEPGFCITMTNELDIVPPADEKVFFEGTIGGEGPFLISQGDSGWSITAPGDVTIRLPGGDGHPTIATSPTCRQPLLSVSASFALDHAVSAFQCCIAHAACIETPDGASRLILHAPSGTGKTTTALALVDRGYRLSSDDATVLARRADGRMAAIGIPRSLKVHRQTARLFGWVSAAMKATDWDTNNEQWFERSTLAALGFLADSSAKPISAVVALNRTDGPMRFAKTSNGAEALTLMLDDNINLGPMGLFPGSENRLSLFSELLASTPSYVLEINGSAHDAAAAIDAGINS